MSVVEVEPYDRHLELAVDQVVRACRWEFNAKPVRVRWYEEAQEDDPRAFEPDADDAADQLDIWVMAGRSYRETLRAVVREVAHHAGYDGNTECVEDRWVEFWKG